MIIDPPKLLWEGRKTNSSKFLGQNFLVKLASKETLLVSCRQRISHLASETLLLTASHFDSALIPLIFQQRTTQLLLCCCRFMVKK
jgi:hypothetical protein